MAQAKTQPRTGGSTPPITAAQIHAVLPQTQCTRCGYDDCLAYAGAIANGSAPINQCPPGGQEGVQRLSRLTGQPAQALNPDFGLEAPRHIVWIDEDWCIGCTLCIKACPVDAIVGTNKRMHTVIEDHCTGCDLCLPVCPVDCIMTEDVTVQHPTQTGLTGWAAWSQPQADAALARYGQRQARQTAKATNKATERVQELEAKAQDIAAHSKITDPALLDQKKAILLKALEKARNPSAS